MQYVLICLLLKASGNYFDRVLWHYWWVTVKGNWPVKVSHQQFTKVLMDNSGGLGLTWSDLQNNQEFYRCHWRNNAYWLLCLANLTSSANLKSFSDQILNQIWNLQILQFSIVTCCLWVALAAQQHRVGQEHVKTDDNQKHTWQNYPTDTHTLTPF